MRPDIYRDYLISHIKPFARSASGGRVITCRCFYCPDSDTPSHSHFYISIPDGKSPSLFYCQKCHAKGMVTPSKLLEWGIYDGDLALELNIYNKRVLSLPENWKYKNSFIYRLMNDRIRDVPMSYTKLNYVNQRLGTNLSFSNILRLKMVLNLGDVIDRNRLQFTRDPRIVHQLDESFVGFMSHDNAFVNLRYLNLIPEDELHESIRKRYINYNLVGKYENTCRFYNIPSEFDLDDPRPLRLHFAEGPFDAVSICLNVRKSLDRDIYIAVGGSGYKGVIRYFILLLKLPNLEIHVYPDNDMGRDEVLDIFDYLEPLRMDFYIHRNVYPGEKDFGVPGDRINETIEKII